MLLLSLRLNRPAPSSSSFSGSPLLSLRHDEEPEKVEDAADGGRARQDDALRDERELHLAVCPVALRAVVEAAEAVAEVGYIGGVAPAEIDCVLAISNVECSQ